MLQKLRIHCTCMTYKMWEHLRKEAITAKNPKQFARNKVQDKTQYPV